MSVPPHQQTKSRIACLWFPHWPLQRLVSDNACLKHLPLALYRQFRGQGDFVSHRNRMAARFGIQPGMPLSEARTYIPDRMTLNILQVDDVEDRSALEHLALAAQQFCPIVGLEEGISPESLLLNLTGVAHLYGGEFPWAMSVQEFFLKKGYQVRIAVAATIGAAWALSHSRLTRKVPCIAGEDEVAKLNGCPVQLLRLDEKTLGILDRLGLKTIGQILALDRNSLTTRLGREVATRLTQLTGEASELITPYDPPPVFQESQEFEIPVTHSETIYKVCHDLLVKLIEKLSSQRLGIVSLQICWLCESSTSLKWTIELCRPTLDQPLLYELCAMKWERQPIVSGVVSISMSVLQTRSFSESTASLFGDRDAISDREFSALIDRLHSRLGDHNVNRIQLTADAIPEHQYCFLSAVRSSAISGIESSRGLPGLGERPLFLTEPTPVTVFCTTPLQTPQQMIDRNHSIELTCSWGPERIESGWWRGPSIRRDYYRVETVDGKRYWIFQRLSDRQWFLHGEMV